MSLYVDLQEAVSIYGDAATDAIKLLESWGCRLVRIPGCDTRSRLAHRMWLGKTLEEAAATEYLYRWKFVVDYLNALEHHASEDRPSWRPTGCHEAPHLLGQ